MKSLNSILLCLLSLVVAIPCLGAYQAQSGAVSNSSGLNGDSELEEVLRASMESYKKEEKERKEKVRKKKEARAKRKQEKRDLEYAKKLSEESSIPSDEKQREKKGLFSEYYKLEKTVYGKTFLKPSVLNDVPFFQLASEYQRDDVTCGYRVIYHIDAIRNLLISNSPITDKAIKTIVSPLCKELKKPELEQLRLARLKKTNAKTSIEKKRAEAEVMKIEEAIEVDSEALEKKLHKCLGGGNYYALRFFKNQLSPLSVPLPNVRMFDEIWMDILKVISNNPQKWFFPLPILVSDHWVLLIIVKSYGKKPVLLYLDSKNTPIQLRGKLAGVIKKFWLDLSNDLIDEYGQKILEKN